MKFRSRIRRLLLSVSFVFPLCAAQPFAQFHAGGDDTRRFEGRCEYIISHFDTAASPGIYGAAVRYARGRDLRAADSILLNSDHLRRPRGDMFWMFPVIGTYLHGKGKMSAEAEKAVRNAWKTYWPYRGDTENHWCLYYSCLLLAAEQWPGLPGPEWFNGRTSEDNFSEAREYLLHWMELTTTKGQGEFDSPTYLPEYLIPMILLGQFALDGDIRTRASMMTDYLLADFAVDHLDGMYIGGLSREGARSVYTPRSAPASEFAWLYFGSGDPVQSSWCLLPALSSYRLPGIIMRIATDRSVPYVNRERKRVRNIIRHGSELNPPVWKYSYVTREYGLSSLQGGVLQPIQQHTWSVRFRGAKPHSTIFGLHPWWSGRELSMFFPEQEKVLIADVARSKGTYNREDKWTGSAPYERTFQHRNTLIVLFDIANDAVSGHVDLFFPSTLDERILDPGGWIFCRAGDACVGVFPLRDGEWMLLAEDEGNHRFRSHERRNGWVVEVRSIEEAESFDKFMERCRARRPALADNGPVGVSYTTIDGDRMDFAFPDDRRLNGAAVDLTKTPLFDSPFLEAETGSGKLLIKHGKHSRLLDFRKGEASDLYTPDQWKK